MAAGKLEKKKRQKKAAVFQFASCQPPASFRETKLGVVVACQVPGPRCRYSISRRAAPAARSCRPP